MRDYRNATAWEFVAESIEAKMKWFARQLRYKDKTTDIEKWARSMSLLIELLQRTKVAGERGSGCRAEIKRMQPQRRKLTISPPCKISLGGIVCGLKGTEELVETKDRAQVMMEVEENDEVPRVGTRPIIDLNSGGTDVRETELPKRRRVNEGREHPMIDWDVDARSEATNDKLAEQMEVLLGQNSKVNEVMDMITKVSHKPDENEEQLVLKCSKGHELKLLRIGVDLDIKTTIWVCDTCGIEGGPDGWEATWQCKVCGLDTCQKCMQKKLIGNLLDRGMKENKEQEAGIDWAAMGVNWDTN